MTLDPDLLLRGYAMGVFPMAVSRESTDIRWIDPARRTVFPLDGFHVSRSLARDIRRKSPRVTANAAFADVLTACADRPETWINNQIFTAYTALHHKGHAHSVEVWDGARLVGGVYGVTLGGAFFGESMFSRATNGSKTALTYLVHRLRAGGFTLFDVQFMTDHLHSLGAKELPRAAYQRQLRAALDVTASFTPLDYPPEPSSAAVLSTFGFNASGTSQTSTQTS